jgi:hypothetical protein
MEYVTCKLTSGKEENLRNHLRGSSVAAYAIVLGKWMGELMLI